MKFLLGRPIFRAYVSFRVYFSLAADCQDATGPDQCPDPTSRGPSVALAAVETVKRLEMIVDKHGIFR